MRRILYYSLLCLLWVSVNSCKEDEAAQPPTPTFTVNRTTGLYQSTEFVFTIDAVSSQAVSLLPYGTEMPNDAGILVPASSFVDGKATIKFVYGHVGTFNAVVVANNHSGDGVSVKNSVSAPTAITITSDRTAILEFSFKAKVNIRGKSTDGTSTATDIDTVAHTINVTVPFGSDLTTLEPVIKASDFSEVTPDGTDYNSDVVFTVVSENGAESTDWTVHVDVTPVETNNNIKSIKGIVSNDNDRAGRVLPASVDTVDMVIALYDTLHGPVAAFNRANYDSVAIDLGLSGKFSYFRYDGDLRRSPGKDTLDLTTDATILVVPQDSTGTVDAIGVDGTLTYTLTVVEAPKLLLNFGSLNPEVNGSSDADFNVGMNVLTGTDVTVISTNYDFDTPVGMSIIEIRANGVIVTGGEDVDYKKPATIQVLVENAAGLQFWVTYTVSVTVLK